MGCKSAPWGSSPGSAPETMQVVYEYPVLHFAALQKQLTLFTLTGYWNICSFGLFAYFVRVTERKVKVGAIHFLPNEYFKICLNL